MTNGETYDEADSTSLWSPHLQQVGPEHSNPEHSATSGVSGLIELNETEGRAFKAAERRKLVTKIDRTFKAAERRKLVLSSTPSEPISPGGDSSPKRPPTGVPSKRESGKKPAARSPPFVGATLAKTPEMVDYTRRLMYDCARGVGIDKPTFGSSKLRSPAPETKFGPSGSGDKQKRD